MSRTPDPLNGATVQAAIDAIVTPPGSLDGTRAIGGIIPLPNGVVTLDKPLMLPSYVALIGQRTGTLLRTKYPGPAIILKTNTDNGAGYLHAVEDMQISVTGGTAIAIDKSISNTENICFRNLQIFGGGIDCRMVSSKDNITYQPTFERIQFYNWGDYAIRCAPRSGRFVSIKCNGHEQQVGTSPWIDLDGWALSASLDSFWLEGFGGPFLRLTGQFSRFDWNASGWNEQHWSNAAIPQFILEGGANLAASYVVARDSAPFFLRGGSIITGPNVMPMDAGGNLINFDKAFIKQ